MKGISIYNHNLPKPVARQLFIIIFSVLVSILFNWIQVGQFFGMRFLYLFIMIVIQVEIAMWVSMKIFGTDEDVISGSYRKTTLNKLMLVYTIVFGVAVLIFIFMVFFEIIVQNTRPEDILSFITGSALKNLVVSIGLGFLIGAVIFFYMQWLDSLKREQKLREEKLIFQYETLKNQVNPHFLFNSLNTLSSLVYKDPELSDEFIRKLSAIYRYILENNEREKVSLSTEIGFVEDFFYLQKIRDNGKIELKISVNNTDNYEILPISLQLLVENALKHNAATFEKPLLIRISQDEGYIEVRNNLQPRLNIDNSAKIGLKNLNERIKLITSKELEILSTKEEYIVRLPLIEIRDESIDH